MSALYPGARKGRWTLLQPLEGPATSKKWLCLCDCGTKRPVRQQNLVTGHSTSCGCLHRERKNRAFGGALSSRSAA